MFSPQLVTLETAEQFISNVANAYANSVIPRVAEITNSPQKMNLNKPLTEYTKAFIEHFGKLTYSFVCDQVEHQDQGATHVRQEFLTGVVLLHGDFKSV